MTAHEQQKALYVSYRRDKHIDFEFDGIYGQAVVDSDMDVIDICIEGVYIGEHGSEYLYEKVKEIINEQTEPYDD